MKVLRAGVSIHLRQDRKHSAHMLDRRRTLHPAGPHLIRVERPDTLFMELHGDVESDHAEIFFRMILAEIPFPKPVYLLRDARLGGFVTPAARAFISRHAIIRRIVGVVSYGAALQTKTVMNMLSRGMRAFQNKEPDMMFAEDELTARRWITEHRQYMAACTV